MSNNTFTLLVAPDGTIEKVGVDTGKMTLCALNERTGFIAYKTAGHTYWASMMEPKKYAPATYQVHKIVGDVTTREWRGQTVKVVLVEDLFGVIEWEVRKQK